MKRRMKHMLFSHSLLSTLGLLACFCFAASCAVGDNHVPFQDSTSGKEGGDSAAPHHERDRYERTVEFSGYEWSLKKSDVRAGPGDNYFSDRPEDVWVDEEGLHLTISEHDGRWWCTEVILQEYLGGWGTYVFHTNNRVDLLDHNTVAGMFTWDNYGDSGFRWPFREIDIEFAQWGNPDDPRNGQFTIQPWDAEGVSHRFVIELDDENPALTTMFRWMPDKVVFSAYRGHHLPGDLPEEDLIATWTYDGDLLQPPGRERVRINMWNFLSKPPSTGERQELLISRFAYFPLED